MLLQQGGLPTRSRSKTPVSRKRPREMSSATRSNSRPPRDQLGIKDAEVCFFILILKFFDYFPTSCLDCKVWLNLFLLQSIYLDVKSFYCIKSKNNANTMFIRFLCPLYQERRYILFLVLKAITNLLQSFFSNCKCSCFKFNTVYNGCSLIGRTKGIRVSWSNCFINRFLLNIKNSNDWIID